MLVAVVVLAVGAVPSAGAQSGSGGVVLVVVNGSSLADVGVAAGLVGGGVGDVVVAAESAGGLGEAAGGVVRDAGVVSGVVLVGGEAALGGAVAAELESLAPGVVVERVSGADRVATAAAAARRVLAGRSGGAAAGVVLADGWSLADVGVAAAVAAAGGADVVLYSGSGSLPDQTRQVLAGEAVGGIVVVGGAAAVPDSVVAAAAGAAGGVGTERVGGKDRVTTAALAARRWASGCAEAAVIANGWSQADVGTAAALAAALGDSVVLYTASADGLGSDTRSALGRVRPQLAVVVGDTDTISDDISDELAELGYPAARVTDAAAAARYALDNDLRNCRTTTTAPRSPTGTETPNDNNTPDNTTPDTDNTDSSTPPDSTPPDSSGNSTPQDNTNPDKTNTGGVASVLRLTSGDEVCSRLSASFSPGQVWVTEGGAAETVIVTLSEAPTVPVTFQLSVTHGGDVSDDDYTLTPSTLVFAADQTQASFTIAADDDSRFEYNETLMVRLASPSSSCVRLSGTERSQAVLVDTDSANGVCSAPAVSLSPSPVSVTEGGAAGTITVTLSEAPQARVTLRLTATHLYGASDDDYELSHSTLVFAADQTQASFTIAASDDSRFERDEVVRLGLDVVSTSKPCVRVWDVWRTAWVTLVDTDAPDVVVGFSKESYRVEEGGAPVTVTAELSEAPQRQVSVPLTFALRGTDRADRYSVSRTELTFAADQTSASLTVSVADDSINNDGHRLSLGFGTGFALPAGFTAAGRTHVTVDIVDDEVGVRLETVSAYALEGGDAAQVRVRLDSPPEEAITIPLTAELRGGAVADDVSYSVEDLSFDFGVGETAKTFTVTAVDDSDDDDGEDLVFALGDLPDSVLSTTATSATIHLIDDDGAFSRQTDKDFDRLIPGETLDDLWSDGTTLWVLGTDRGIYALDMDALTRRQGDDITTLQFGNQSPPTSKVSGLWSDGETMWLADDSSPNWSVVAVDVDTGDRLPDRDFALFRAIEAYPPDPESVWSDGELMWVLDQLTERVHAYDFGSGERVSSRTINLYPQFSQNRDARGIWSDGVTMWVSNTFQAKLYAYDLATGVRRSHLDFVNLGATGNAWPAGIWSDGRTMWVANYSEKIYAYNMPVSAALKSLSISDVEFGVFQTGIFSYEGTAAAGTTSVTVTAAAAFADDATVTIAWEAADGTTGTGASATLSAGDNTITVSSSYDADGDADTDNADVRVYTVTVTVPPAADD